jgi:quinoprotein glucose dehydrogenase
MKTILQMLLCMCCTFVLYGAPADGEGGDENTPEEPPPRKTEMVPSEWNSAVKIPLGHVMDVFADEEQLKNPTAITLDHHGRVFVAETHRWRKQIHDNRNVPIRDFKEEHGNWLMEDLACRTTADRHNMLKRWADGGRFREFADFSHFTADAEKIRLLIDADGDGVAESGRIFSERFNSSVSGTAGGIMAWDDSIFFANIPSIWELKDSDYNGVPDSTKLIQEGFGVRTSISGHDLNGFAIGPDRRIYWTVGDRGYDVKTKEGRHYQGAGKGAAFRCELDGSKVERFCDGLRNPKEVVFDDYGNLFTVDNNADIGDKARLYYLVPGGDYGWRMGHQVCGQSSWVFGEWSTPMPSPWMEEGLWELPFPGQPAYVMPPIDYITSGPCGFLANPGTAALGNEFDGHFFIVDYRGAAARSGIHTFSMEPWGAGFRMVDGREMVMGIALTDMEFGYDGKMYICDFIGGWLMPDAGRVLTLYDPAKVGSFRLNRLEKLARQDFSTMSSRAVAGLLDHVDRRIRLRAQFALEDKIDGARYLTKAAQGRRNELLQRLHGVWGMGNLARKGNDNAATVLVGLLQDSDGQVRAQAARMLADVPGNQAAVDTLRRMTNDTNAYARSQAAFALGYLKDRRAVGLAIGLLEENQGLDLELRQAGMFILEQCATVEELASLHQHESEHVRMAAVVALRRLRSPQIAKFLGDDDMLIVAEAGRAIYDEGIEGGYAELAKWIDRLQPFNGNHLGNSRGDPNQSVDERAMRNQRQFHRRVIYANWRAGGVDNARALMAYAANKDMPELMRLEALDCVHTWANPHPLDRVIGDRRDVAPRDATAIYAAVLDDVEMLVKRGNGKVLQKAVEMSDTVGYEVPVNRLYELIINPKMDSGARARALEKWLATAPKNAEFALTMLLAEAEDQVFLDALKALSNHRADLAAAVIKLVIYSPRASNHRRQQAVLRLAELDEKSSTPVLAKALNQMKGGRFPKQIQLEVVAAAEKAAESSDRVAAVLAEWKAVAALDLLGEFSVTLEGGWDKRGGEIYEQHAVAQCARCHSLYGRGGKAAPDLGGIGARADGEYIVESLLKPSAKVAAGWGILTLKLSDGTAVAGTLVKETFEHFVVLVGEDEVKVKREDVVGLTDPVSSMPPMGAILTKEEIRHLVAYLKQQKRPYHPPEAKK